MRAMVRSRLGLLLAWVTLVPLLLAACDPTAPLGLSWDRTTDVERPSDVVPQAMASAYRHPGHFIAQAVVTGVAHGAAGWAAVGYAGPPWRSVAWSSSDGRVWRLAQVEATEGSFLEAVMADGPGFLAAGRAAGAPDRPGQVPALWRSGDGRSWTRVPDPVLADSAPGRLSALAIGAGPEPIRVAGGFAGPELGPPTAALWRSADGETWAAAELDETADARVAAIAPVPGGGFVAAGWRDLGSGSSEAAVWSSPDGLRWSSVRSTRFADGRIHGLARSADGLTLLAVGTDADERRARAWRSTDGVTWEALDSPSFAYHGQKVRMLGVAALPEGGFVAVGNVLFGTQYGSARVWRSPDGRSWSIAPESDSFAQGEMLAVAVDLRHAISVGSFGAPDSYLPTIWLSPPAP